MKRASTHFWRPSRLRSSSRQTSVSRLPLPKPAVGIITSTKGPPPGFSPTVSTISPAGLPHSRRIVQTAWRTC